ncbi:MAG: GFA family protein, partial [Alphaproteobacteria bacterium]|nr:GFA family protein [Alphaproteobacteria bacterium]
EGEPVRISMCHCLECQKRTGSTYAVQARWPATQVKIEGNSSRFSRTGDEGNVITFHFCPNCGATVYYQFDARPELIAVAVGNFADPSFPAPRVSVFESRKHAWVSVPQDAEHH